MKDERNKGRLENHNDFKILYISGSHYEMGFQFGNFLKEEYFQNQRAWLNGYDKRYGVKYKDLLKAWNKTVKYMPQEYIEEIQGRADALNISFEEVAVMDMIGNIVPKKIGCCGMAAWGPATSDGELYHLRSQDLSLDLAIDPITGIHAYENRLVVVRKPNNGFASIFPASPCHLGVEGGFNEKSICLGWKSSDSKDQTLDGLPICIRQLMVLDHASNLDNSAKIINSNRSIGCNLIISDGKKPDAIVIEQSANHNYIGTWDNPNESLGKGWTINHVIRRTNFFINPLLVDTQPEAKHNRSKFLWSFFPMFRHYVAVSKGIEKNWGKLNLNKTMETLRSIYNGKTDVFFMLYYLINKRNTFNQWVACPKSGDILFSFAKDRKNAYESPVYSVNLFQLLKSEPK